MAPTPNVVPEVRGFMKAFIASLGIATKEALTFNALRRRRPGLQR